MKKIIIYSIVFFILMSLALFLHIQLLPFSKTFIVQSYTLNGFMAIISIFILKRGMQIKKNDLSTFYFISVALKLIIYFLFFRPQFEIYKTLVHSEFFIFFIPYSIGLVFEIIFLARRYS